jgi:uncharacterized membrane protein
MNEVAGRRAEPTTRSHGRTGTAGAALARVVALGRQVPVLAVLVAAALLLFLLAPWPLSHKAQAVLHGLCAQRPTHSFTMGGVRLPFDARMTGIYGGFAFASLWLLARGRYRRAALPGRWSLAVLALFIVAMGVDGFNSFLLDARLRHPYGPDNRLRLATGLMTGITLAVAVGYVLAVCLWRRPDVRRAPIEGGRDFAELAAIQAPYVAVVLSGVGFLYDPVALLLVLSAAAVLTAMMLVVVLMLTRREGTIETVGQLQRPAAAAFVLALVLMGALGGGRFLLERLMHVPPMA